MGVMGRRDGMLDYVSDRISGKTILIEPIVEGGLDRYLVADWDNGEHRRRKCYSAKERPTASECVSQRAPVARKCKRGQ